MAGRPKRSSGRFNTPPLQQPQKQISKPHVEENPKAGISNSSASQVLLAPQTLAPQTQTVPAKPASEEPIQMEENHEQPQDVEMEDKKTKKFFGGVRKRTTREKKIRQNIRLQKILLPKNALMALHEVQGINMSDFTINSAPEGFLAVVTVNNIPYEGRGTSKLLAKNDVCEKVLRDLFLSRIIHNANKNKPNENFSSNNGTKVVPCAEEDVQMTNSENEEETVPIANLASYALYKLFSEWEKEGFDVPAFRNNTLPPTEKPKKPSTIRSELPPNWETFHPTTLLCLMRPGTNYVDLGCDGIPPNQTQKIGVTVDEESFIGYGRSKKMARRDAALLACNKIFRTNFTKEA